MAARGFVQRNHHQTIGLRCGNAKATGRSTAGQSRRQPRHHGLDAGDRAADGHRLGRGLHPRPRSAAARLVSRAARSCPSSQPNGDRCPSTRSWFRTSTTRRPARDQLDSRSKLLFDRDVLAWFWPFAREEPHGHPPFYALLGLAGDVLAPSWQELPRARLGPILLFSLTAGAIFWLRRLPLGRLGGGPRGRVPGSCSQICSATVITRPTTPF